MWFYGLKDVPELGTAIEAYINGKPLWPFYNPFCAAGAKINKDTFKAAIVATMKLFKWDVFFKPVM